MATPLFRGNPMRSVITIPGGSPIGPVEENGTLTITVGEKYNFLAGSTVIVSRFFDGTTRFEAIVTSYTSGVLVLSQITNIQGTWTSASGQFVVAMTGQRGSKIIHGNGHPSDNIGRSGDTYIDDTSGTVYYK